MRLFGSSKQVEEAPIELLAAPESHAADAYIDKTFLGKYRVRKFLGEGSNAHVFLAQSAGDPNSHVVLKRIKDEATAAPRFRQFFEAEVHSMLNFHHPYVVRLLDASLDDPLGACLVLDYIPGVTLEAILTRDRILRACKRNGLAFLEACWPENVKQRIDDGVRVLAGGREDASVIGRAYQGRQMPV